MKLYNTLSGKTETFSADGDVVKMYVCGVTPYAPSHLGHAMRAVVFDVLRRYLEFKGFKLKHVENFTDIDDKMIQGAASAGVTTHELAEKNIEQYLSEMDALNVLRADIYPRATQEIPGIQEMIKTLVEKGLAYEADGDVYFRVRRDEDYGKLSGGSLDSMKAGARVEINEKKEDLMDFVLWKAQKPGEPAWDSPWGPGRPGWHIECSAMVMRYLGETVDIHGGGRELIFPHHENEIAQTESCTGTGPMARFWVHNALVMFGADKMSKSLGNVVPVADALESFSPDALRLFCLSSHYRSPLTYSDSSLAAQERAAERLRNALGPSGSTGQGPALAPDAHKDRFMSDMDDDLNTPRAIAVLFDLAHDINRAREEGQDVAAAQGMLKELAGVLGLTLEGPADEGGSKFYPVFHLLLDTDAELRSAQSADIADRLRQQLEERGISLEEVLGTGDRAPQLSQELTSAEVEVVIELLIETREALRAARRYELADRVRQRLSDLGFVLEDTPDGTEWKRRAR